MVKQNVDDAKAWATLSLSAVSSFYFFLLKFDMG